MSCLTSSVDGRHPGRAADQDHVVDVGHLDPGVLDRLLERALAAVQQVLRHALELGPGQGHVQVQRARRAGRDVGQVDAGRGGRGQLDLGLLGRLAEALHGHLVLAEVDAVLAAERLDQVVDDPLVPVVATEVVVTAGRLDLDHALGQLEQRDVERAAAEVEDEDGLLLGALVQAVGERGRGRLVDDPQHVEARDLAGLLGGLPLGVVEVRRHGDHRVGDALAEVGLGVALELHQHPRGDLLRGVLLAVDVDGPVRAHLALDRADRPVRVRHRLALGHLPDEHLAVLGKRDDRRRGAGTLGVRDDCGLATLEHAHHGVRRAEVDADRTCHVASSTSVIVPVQVERTRLNVATPIRQCQPKLSLSHASPSPATHRPLRRPPVASASSPSSRGSRHPSQWIKGICRCLEINAPASALDQPGRGGHHARNPVAGEGTTQRTRGRHRARNPWRERALSRKVPPQQPSEWALSGIVPHSPPQEPTEPPIQPHRLADQGRKPASRSLFTGILP